jgi:hypothetical protein
MLCKKANCVASGFKFCGCLDWNKMGMKSYQRIQHTLSEAKNNLAVLHN